MVMHNFAKNGGRGELSPLAPPPGSDAYVIDWYDKFNKTIKAPSCDVMS